MNDVDPIEWNQALFESQLKVSPVPPKKFAWSSVRVDSLVEHEASEPVEHVEPAASDGLQVPPFASGQKSLRRQKKRSYADCPKRLNCPLCARAFPWLSALKRHILTHSGTKFYRCPKCTLQFSTKSNRERHLRRTHGILGQQHLQLLHKQLQLAHSTPSDPADSAASSASHAAPSWTNRILSIPSHLPKSDNNLQVSLHCFNTCFRNHFDQILHVFLTVFIIY